MADWFNPNMLPASMRGPGAARAAGAAARSAEANAWTKMAERRQGLVNAGIPGRKTPPAPDMRHGAAPIRYPEDRESRQYGQYGVAGLAAPVFRLAANVTKPNDWIYDYNVKRNGWVRVVPGNPRKRNMLNEWADLLDQPYEPKSIPGIENIKSPDIRYRGPEQIAGLLPGHVGQMLARNKK